MDIDTKAVLQAAGTKWNFIPFTPGLVGGHCIGVDPYYLAQKAIETGYNPEIILAGRKMNDSMGGYVAQETVKMMIKKGATIKNSNALVLGITFKENCPDIRNTKAIDVYKTLASFNMNVDVYDPWADKNEVESEYGITLKENLNETYDAIIHTVAHTKFKTLDITKLAKENAVIYDVKGTLDVTKIDKRL